MDNKDKQIQFPNWLILEIEQLADKTNVKTPEEKKKVIEYCCKKHGMSISDFVEYPS